jgi:hypothetical protein
VKTGSNVLRIGRAEGFAAAAALMLSAIVPAGRGLPKLCIFSRATGYPCPFCGLSRSFSEISHGDLVRASLYHPLGLAAYFITAVTATRAVGHPVRLSLSVRHLTAIALMIGAAWVLKLFLIPRRYW